MRALKLMVPAAILMTGFVVCTMNSYGKQEYAQGAASDTSRSAGEACTAEDRRRNCPQLGQVTETRVPHAETRRHEGRRHGGEQRAEHVRGDRHARNSDS